MAAFDVDGFAYRAMGERFMDMWKTGRAHPASSNMMKYVGTELNKRRHELVMSGGGSEALEWDSEETKGGARARGWLRTKANSIEGGTSEVMLNVIAKRILDFPGARSEEHTSEIQSLMRISYAVFCLQNTKHPTTRSY